MAQARHAADEPARLRFAREIVAAKLHNQATLATRFGWHGCDRGIATLRSPLKTRTLEWSVATGKATLGIAT